MIKIFFKHTYVEGPSVLRQILLTFTLPISQILDTTWSFTPWYWSCTSHSEYCLYES